MDIQFPQIIFQIINFGVVAGALTYLLYKPVKKMLDDRSNKIEEAQKAAELTIAEKHQIEEMKKKAHKEAEKEAAQLMEEAEQTAQSRRNEIIKKAKDDAAKEVSKMKQNVEDEKRALMEQIKKEFNDTVLNTVEKVVGAADTKAQEKLIDIELSHLLKRM